MKVGVPVGVFDEKGKTVTLTGWLRMPVGRWDIEGSDILAVC